MIQRIQSIYLFVTAIIMAVTIFCPLITMQQISRDHLTVSMDSLGFFFISQPDITFSTTWGTIIIAILSSLLALINIFLYKRRKLQLKICKYTSTLILLFYITLGAYYFISSGNLYLKFLHVDYGIILPIIALIFNLLATSRIKSDQKLIDSLNRIR